MVFPADQNGVVDVVHHNDPSEQMAAQIPVFFITADQLRSDADDAVLAQNGFISERARFDAGQRQERCAAEFT